MDTISQILKTTKQRLKQQGIDTWSIDGELLVCAALGLTRIQLVTHDIDIPDEENLNKLDELLSQRLAFKPMQYILGKCEFMGMEFGVNKYTLIPRPDTEVLVENVISVVNKHTYKTVLDIGTGSGAIGISVGKFCPQTWVTASDISVKALETAKNNSISNNVKNITFTKSNIFDNIKERYDVIVSNPPYIRTDVIDTLDSQVKDYEPVTALDGGKDGLYFYRQIIKGKNRLNKGGYMAFEIGFDQGEQVKELMENNGFVNVSIIKDLAGLDRVVSGYEGE